jgi:hypothetical protein
MSTVSTSRVGTTCSNRRTTKRSIVPPSPVVGNSSR